MAREKHGGMIEGLTMTPSKQAKAAGLKSLAEVSRLTGQSMQTLGNWHKHKPELFAIVLAGCYTIKNKG